MAKINDKGMLKMYCSIMSYQAVAWCPWQPNVLASGGGTADRHIRFWNANTGSCLNSVDTNSQVCLNAIFASKTS